MVHIPLKHSIQRYLWSIGLALLSMVLISSSLFSQTVASTIPPSSATLVVIKEVINDNGGSLGASDFTLKVIGTNPLPDAFPGAGGLGTEVTLDPGTYEVLELPPSGYSVSYSSECSGTIALGEIKTCTVTNDDKPPTLKVVKQVINDNGGTLSAGQFTLSVTGDTPSPASFAGAESPGTTVSIKAGTYNVSETAPSDYAVSYSAECSGTIALGETKTCTVINDDKPPTLKVIKQVINDNGGTLNAAQFTLNVTGNTPSPASFSGAESPGTTVSIKAGAYNVSETAPSDYAVSYSAGCSGTIALGETKTCTVTNDDKPPTLKVIKHVINNNGGTLIAGQFTLNITGNTPSPASFSGAESPGTTVALKAGAYNVSEAAPSGYAVSYSTECSGTIALGETKTCTVTNDDAPATLIVIKKVINDHGGLLTAGQFNLKVTGNVPTPALFTGSETGTTIAIGPGSYNVLETLHSTYAVSYSPECSGTIALGETKTCTVTNDDKPARLRIVKQVVNNNGGTLTVPDFALFIDGIPVTSGTFISVTAGLHTVSETPHPRYAGTFSNNNCTGGQTTLTLGQQRTCTLVNDDRPLGITLQKSASSASVQPGTAVVYSYDVSTSDAVPLTTISVSDDKCAPVQPVNNSGVNSGDSNQNSTLDPGEVWKYTCSAVLQVDTVNIASVQGTPVGGGLPVSATAQATVDVRASIQVTTTPSTLSVPPLGGVVNFTVKIRNLSQGDLVTIQNLQDNIFGNITDANNPKLQTTNCVTPRAIAIGATYTCTFAALVSGTLGQQHINTLLTQGIDDDEQPVDGSASASVSITGSLLQPTKSATLAEDADQNNVPSPGDTLEYTVVMQNKGNEPANSIIFQDTPDPNTTLVIGSVQSNRGTIDLGNGNGHSTVKITVGTINPTVTVTIRFKVKVNDPLPNNVTQVKNQGAISGQTIAQTLTDDPNTLSVGDATITPLNLAPLIGGSKTARLVADRDNNGVATAGDTLEYKITITNQGSRTANGVILNDTVDAQTLLEVGTVQTNRGTVAKGNQFGDSTVQVNVGDLAGSSNAVIIFQVTIKNPLPAGVIQVSNQGLISGSNFPTTATDDPTTPASNDPTKTQVAIGPLLDATKLATLSVDADQNGQPGPGDTLHYQIRIINSGNALASSVAFVDKLGENTTLLTGSVTTTQGDITRGNGSVDSEVNVTINNINAGGEVVITYKALVNNPLPPTVIKVANQGLVISQNLPPVLTDDPSTPAEDDPTQTQVRILPELAATKRATLLLDNDNDQVAEPGDTLLYEVALINSGNATATTVHFVDIVDASTTLVPNSVQSSQGTVQGGNNPGDTQVQVEIGSLAGSGATANISYRVTIKNPLPAQAVEMVNQGTVQSKELDPVLTDDPTTSAANDATRTQVIASPRLQVIKQDLLWIDGDDDRQVTLNDQLLYQIKIINTGNVAATNVLLQDTVDPRTVLVDSSVQSSQGVIQQGNAAGDLGVTLAIGTIPPNGVVNIGFRVRVNANENGQLSNQAIVTHEQPAPSGTRAQPIQLVSDDPDTAETSDPTLTPIVRKGSGQDSGPQRIYMPLVRRTR